MRDRNWSRNRLFEWSKFTNTRINHPSLQFQYVLSSQCCEFTLFKLQDPLPSLWPCPHTLPCLLIPFLSGLARVLEFELRELTTAWWGHVVRFKPMDDFELTWHRPHIKYEEDEDVTYVAIKFKREANLYFYQKGWQNNEFMYNLSNKI